MWAQEKQDEKGIRQLVRRNDRHEMRKSVRIGCQVVRERDFRLVATRTFDLSPDGMLVPTDEQLTPGETLHVSFQATQLGIWFDTDAVVTRMLHGRRDRDMRPSVGLTFSTLDRVKRLVLRGHLRRIPPPVPMRAARIDWSKSLEPSSAQDPGRIRRPMFEVAS